MEQLQKDIMVVKQSMSQQSKAQDMAQWLSKELEKVLELDDLTHELLNRLVEKMEVGEDQRIRIHYKSWGRNIQRWTPCNEVGVEKAPFKRREPFFVPVGGQAMKKIASKLRRQLIFY